MNYRFKMAVVGASSVLVLLLLIGAVLGQGTSVNSSDPYRHINVYTEVFSRIKSEYVEEPEMKNVTLGAINGLLVSLDPFASYLNAEQYKNYLKTRQTAKGDIGLLLSRKYGFDLNILDAIPGSPADKAGLATGDVVEAINGVSTRDMPLAYAEIMLMGEPNTSVELTVLRLRKPEPTKISLTRAKIELPAVTHKLLDGQVGYVQARSLDGARVKAVADAVAALDKQGMQKLVLDLRHSSTGDPAQGFELANLFIEKGALGSVSGQKAPKQSFEADPAKTLYKGPLALLTNRGTAGAAEVAATAMLESKRAQVIGERTYGDAAVRKPVTLTDGGAVILSAAKYYGPAGKAIQDASVVPNVLVADSEPTGDEEEETPQPSSPAKSGEDPILKKALEVLTGNVKVDAAGSDAAKPVRPETPPVKLLTPLNTPKKK